MSRTTRILAVIVLSSVVSTAGAHDLDLELQVGAVHADLAPVRGIVKLRNTGNTQLVVEEPEAGVNVKLRLTQVRAYGADQCFERDLVSGPFPRPGARVRALDPGSSTELAVDLLKGYRLGLRPGRYRVHAQYSVSRSQSWTGTLESDPVEFEVVVPSGPSAASYVRFLDVCSALIRREKHAARDAVLFVEENDAFPYNAMLLSRASDVSTGEMKVRASEALIQRFPTSPMADVARRNVAEMATRSEDLAAYREHLTAYADALRSSTPDAAEARQLRPITRASGFRSYQAFVSRFPDSALTPDVIHSMIVAIDEGILPEGVSPKDSDRARADLYRQLARYEEHYWARRLLNNPAVKELVERNPARDQR